MKIDKLIMSAFGPFKDIQTIDFGPLNEKSIFLISGPTGSGKTTLFDAISYALYGESSGNLRSGEAMRSHFADINESTYVELFFSIKGKSYHIKRMPTQERPKLRSEGTTTMAHNAVLTLPDGTVLSKLDEVKQKVLQIIGINHEQFRQIVMLPQGEFQKLLNAKSIEREEIFRKIFDTYLYKDFQDLLNEKEKALNEKLKEASSKIAAQAKLIDTDNLILKEESNNDSFNTKLFLNLLEEEIKSLGQNIKKISEEKKKLNNEKDNLSEEFQKSKEINVKIAALEEAKNNLTSLEKDAKRMEGLKMDIEKISFAKQTMQFEDNYNEKNKMFIENNNQIELCKKDLEESKGLLETAQKNLSQTEDLNIKIQEHQKETEKLNEMREEVLKYDSIVKKLSERIEVKDKIDLKLVKNNKEINDLKDSLINMDQDLSEITQLKLSLEKLKFDKEKIERKLQQIRKLSEVFEDILNTQKKYTECFKKYEEEKKYFEKKRTLYLKKRDLFLSQQAGLLAQELEDEMPCPVCGSTSHPNPSKVTSDISGANDFNKLTETFEKESSEFNRLENELNGLLMLKLNGEERFKSDMASEFGFDKDLKGCKTFIDDTLCECEKSMKLNDTQTKSLLKKVNQEGKLKTKIANAKNKQSLLEEELENLRKKQPTIESDIALLKCDKERFEEHVTKELRDVKKLDKKISDNEISVKKLRNCITNIQKEYDDCNKKYTVKETELSTYQAQAGNFKSMMLKANELFLEMITAHFDNIDEYILYKSRMDTLDRIKKEVEEHNVNLRDIRNDISRLEGEIGDRDKVDLEKILSELNKKAVLIEVLDQQIGDLNGRLNNNQGIKKSVAKTFESIQKTEGVYDKVATLSKAASGNNNYKISFERYVLAHFFVQIIDLANEKFYYMTSSRYRLDRKNEKSKGNQGQGLDLTVYDNYTGQYRDVSTLSGGESFKASLALALALAETVQSHAGGIGLDTIFIDEGFGTLDPDSLETAIETLVGIKNSGRIVGVISHVEELKNRIEAKIQIESTPKGSNIKGA